MQKEKLGQTVSDIGVLTCRMIDGVLFLFDTEGRRLNAVRRIAVEQGVDDVTIAKVEMIIDMARD